MFNSPIENAVCLMLIGLINLYFFSFKFKQQGVLLKNYLYNKKNSI